SPSRVVHCVRLMSCRPVVSSSRRHTPSSPFFFHHTATTEIYTLSLHDALPIYHLRRNAERAVRLVCRAGGGLSDRAPGRLPRRVGPRRRPRPRRPRQCSAEWLADEIGRAHV